MDKKVSLVNRSLGFALLACILGGACDVSRTTVTSRSDAVWADDGYVYFLREENSDGNELWRKRPGQSEHPVLSISDIPGQCGNLDFTFPLHRGAALGLALNCGKNERLLSYRDGKSVELRDVPKASMVTLAGDLASGYVVRGMNLCVGLYEMHAGTASLDKVLPQFSCKNGAIREPRLLPNGDLYFMATKDVPRNLAAATDRSWRLYVKHPRVQAVPLLDRPFVGIPDLDVKGDGSAAIVALSTDEHASLITIDLRTGEDKTIREEDGSISSPSFSPNGTKLSFIRDFSKIAITRF